MDALIVLEGLPLYLFLLLSELIIFTCIMLHLNSAKQNKQIKFQQKKIRRLKEENAELKEEIYKKQFEENIKNDRIDK